METYTSGIVTGVNDAREIVAGGAISLDRERHSLVTSQLIILRYQDVIIPQGAEIRSAFIQFMADDTDPPGNTDIIVNCELSTNSPVPSLAFFDISSRTLTSSTVTWDAPPFTDGSAGAAEKSIDLSIIVQEVVDQGGWISGNALSFILTSANLDRFVAAYEKTPGGGFKSAVLTIDFEPIPVVFAGDDQGLVGGLPQSTTMDTATVSDPAATLAWTVPVGPGAPTFDDTAILRPEVEFTVYGDYTLLLTATNGAGESSSDVQVTVAAPLFELAPRPNTFLLSDPTNYSKYGRPGADLVFAADSEEPGRPAANLGFDDGSATYRSFSIGPLMTVTIDVDHGQTILSSAAAMNGNNLQVPWSIELWAGDPDGGGTLKSSRIGLDSIVRDNAALLPPVAQSRLDNLTNVSAVRYVEVSHSWTRFILDVSEGNAGIDFVEISWVYVGKIFDISVGLDKGNSLTLKGLSPVSMSRGGAGFENAEVPLRSQAVPLSFLESSDYLALGEWLGSKLRAEKVLIWRSPQELDTFALEGFWGVPGKSSPSLAQSAAGGSIKKISSVDIEERR